METVAFPIQFVNGLLQYLSTRPYSEVAQIIAIIQENAKQQAEQVQQGQTEKQKTE